MKKNIIYIDNFLLTHGKTPTSGEAMVALLKNEGFNVVRASSKNDKLLRLFDMLKTIYLNRKKAVVLIAVYGTTAFYFACLCAWLCRLLKLPYIPKLHGGSLPSRIKRSYRLSKNLFGKSAVNIAVSGYLGQCMEDNKWKYIIIPNPIHISDYPFSLRSNCAPKILWVRSFHSIYHPQLAIKVLNRLLKKYPGAYLTMVGPDKDGTMTACKLLVKELGLEQKVTFTGLLSKSEWINISADHDIFLNTTNFDNLPVSVMEGMALGMIVISTNVGGVPYLVRHGENGLLVNPNDRDAILNAINQVLNDAPLASKLSNAARQDACKYDYDYISEQWVNLLHPLYNQIAEQV